MSSWWHVPLCQNHIYTGLSLHFYRKVLENSLKDSLLGYSPQIGANTIFHFLLKKKKQNCLFIYLGVCWVFVAVCRLSPVVVSRGQSLLWCPGFSLQCLFLLWSLGSRRMGFSTCSTWAQYLCTGLVALQLPFSIWDPPAVGIELLSPALAGGFLNTGPPGKPSFLSQIDY